MQDLLKSKIITGLVVVATIILAAVAIFTAFRLYNLRQISVTPTSPGSKPLAWDCSRYTLSVSSTGIVSVSNQSSISEPAQQARIYINDSLVATLDVPALNQGQSANIGTVQVPPASFRWRVVGSLDCQSSGESLGGPVSCQKLVFTITQNTPTPTKQPTTTPSPTPSSTSTPAPTQPPAGGTETTPTPTPTQQSTPTRALTSTSTPTPTSPVISTVSPTPRGGTLPNAGISFPTIFGLTLGVLILLISFFLAI